MSKIFRTDFTEGAKHGALFPQMRFFTPRARTSAVARSKSVVPDTSVKSGNLAFEVAQSVLNCSRHTIALAKEHSRESLHKV